MQTSFMSGCFDGPNGPHDGHKYILNYAKLYGENLIVGLNSDEYIERKKGRKPFLKQEDRKGYLYDLGVKICIIFDDSPLHLIKSYKPDYLIVGNDYKPNEIIGYDEIKEWGGKVIIVERVLDISTTKIWKSQQNK